jgi:uncharacterized protein GlcG (DUF336 family)
VPLPNAPYGVSIAADTTEKLAAAAIAEARENNRAMAVAIVDTGGYLEASVAATNSGYSYESESFAHPARTGRAP